MPQLPPSAGTLPPADPNVSLPPAVARAAAFADAVHERAYATAQPAPEPQPQPQPEPQPQPQPAPEPQPQPQLQPQPPPAPESPPDWEARYHAMRGRFDQSQTTIGSMQEQIASLSDTVMQMQQPRQQAPLPTPRKLITADDEKNYTPELIDLMKRAAVEAVAPEIEQLSQVNRQVVQRVTQTSRATVYDKLDTEVPTWREINISPRFKTWCSLPDVYSGALRGVLLRNAFQAADAPRVTAIFKGFLNEEQATGQLPAAQPGSQQSAPTHAPALALEALAAPGRAHPAGGNTQAVEKPVFTHADIRSFYNDVRRGVYAGRDAEKNQKEQDIFSAQREGRVR